MTDLTISQAIERCHRNERVVRSDNRRRWERLRHPRLGRDHLAVPNAYSGSCCVCGANVAPREGQAIRDGRRWVVLCNGCGFDEPRQ